MPRRSAAATAATHHELLEAAVKLASIEGLEGLTIGRLAEQVGMSKSGVIAHFGTKEQLQLQTFRRSLEIFDEAVRGPLADMPPGLERLRTLCSRWISFLAGGRFPGGCFMTTAAVEYDARSGVVHDAVAGAMRAWLRLLRREITAAQNCGDLNTTAAPADTAFALNALVAGANILFQLHGDRTSFHRARRAIDKLLLGAQPTPRDRRRTARM